MTTAANVSEMEMVFLEDICKHPADDVPRLIFADWLDENNIDADRSEFIRVQVDCANQDYLDSRGLVRSRLTLSDRAYAILSRHCEKWSPLRSLIITGVSRTPATERPDDYLERVRVHYGSQNWVEYHRGFVSTVRLWQAAWAKWGKAMIRWHPITRVEFSDVWMDHVDREPGFPSWQIVRRVIDETSEKSVNPWSYWKGWYNTAELALDAVSEDAIKWAKETPPM